MYNNQYLNDLLNKVKTQYSNEPEFIQAVEEFFDSMDLIIDKEPDIKNNAILERLIVPERAISFRVPWVDDNGKIQVNTGYRVQFNSAIGPYKGGIRFDKSVNLSILKFLGFEQIFKNSLTGLPMGGGKGGSDFDPRNKSDAEVMRFCQSFVTELFKYVGPNTDIPAGDLGCGAREIGYMFGQYKRLTDTWSGTFTGKDFSYGGSLLRPEATGFGLLYFVEEMLKTFKNTTIKGKKVIISGTGNVGSHAIEKAHELGAVIVAVSDRDGYVYDEKGLDIKEVLEICSNTKAIYNEYVKRHPTCKHGAPKEVWNNKCDIALPCATQGEISLKEAKELKVNGCFMVVEGANMPVDLEAIRFFNTNDVLFAPGKAANAGGVAVSGLEMSQNALHLSWSKEEVDEKLHQIMKDIFNKCYETAKQYGQPKNIAMGANIAGFLKVYKAMVLQGIC